MKRLGNGHSDSAAYSAANYADLFKSVKVCCNTERAYEVLNVFAFCLMLQLFGEPESFMSQAVFLPGSIDGQGTMICSYPDMTATLQWSKTTQGALPSEIQGEDGSIIFNLYNPFENLPLLLDIPIVKAGTESSPVPLGTGPYTFADSEDGAVPHPFYKRRSPEK